MKMVMVDDMPSKRSSIRKFDPSTKSVEKKKLEKWEKKMNARVSRPDVEVRHELSILFSEKQAWTFKEIRDRIRVPDTNLKNNLEVLAEYHESGDYHRKWVVKNAVRSIDDDDEEWV
eukprot:CAMPEP_0117429038 /NCGR_PEP_ID=MMETSP0758-20121206/8614_1 /TAXON_ID=63605 /ORGANISM="Percolomonas cosmopolitus, Strain AE-1 (ATCC 50343)" /LENGTH=116 /DNA_ID=CAMNT_0005215731 /DNA_START=300 /DNA_END=653 /DNA_ORIENTATION=-